MILFLIFLIFLLLFLTGLFLWSNRRQLLINPVLYFTVFVYIIPFVLIPFFDQYCGMPFIYYNRVPYEINTDILAICLSIALLSFGCFVFGYYFKTKTRSKIFKVLVFSNRLSFFRIHPILVALFLFAVFIWFVGAELSYGFGFYLQYFAQIRGNPNFETFSNTAFLIHLGRNISFLPMYLWIGQYAAYRKYKGFAFASLFFVMLMVFTAGGRGLLITTLFMLICIWYGSKQKKPSKIMLMAFLIIALIVAVSGRTILNYQSYIDGLAVFKSSIELQLNDISNIQERLSSFGNSMLHLSFVYEDVGNQYDYFLFRDIPLIPFYVIPKMIHGINPMVANIVFNDIYYPVRYGNAPPMLLAYLYWSLGLPGIIAGSLLLGYLAGIVRSWTFRTARLPGFYGIAIVVAYKFNYLSTGYMSITVKSLFPYVLVIVILLVVSRIRLSYRTINTGVRIEKKVSPVEYER